MSAARKDRKARLTESRSGSWGSSSQDYIRHATKLFEHSTSCARSGDGNCSAYTLSGLPILFSAIRAMLIESNSGMYGLGRDENALKRLGDDPNELHLIVEKYRLSGEHEFCLSLLYEVRNEIIHPAHMPAGTSHGTPVDMLRLRELDLLQSTCNDNSNYIWMAQLQSHRLFRWAFSTIEDVAAIILKEHHASQEDFIFHMQSYSKYKEYDLVAVGTPVTR
jgi:hypothetical protein